MARHVTRTDVIAGQHFETGDLSEHGGLAARLGLALDQVDCQCEVLPRPVPVASHPPVKREERLRLCRVSGFSLSQQSGMRALEEIRV